MGSSKDPMCDPNDTGGGCTEIGCRKNFVLLISDGEYTTKLIDPLIPAHYNFTHDIRPDDDETFGIDGDQNIMTSAV